MKIIDIIPLYLKQLTAWGRSPFTIRHAKYDLLRLCRYLEPEGLDSVEDLSREVLEDYQQELAFTLTAKGNPLSLRTQEKRLCNIKVFTRYLASQDYLIDDPGRYIQLPKQPRRLPRRILSSGDIKKMMAACDMQTTMGYRDRVVLEILYDTGLRRLEVARLKLADLDLDSGVILVTGKGDKQRVVPISQRVCELIKAYLIGIRPDSINGADPGDLFLNPHGKPINAHLIWQIVKRCARLAGLKAGVTTHTFRHTCATHMLKNGAPIRHLQEMLGHESLESTQIYTHVTINDLKKIHTQYHPSEANPNSRE